VSAPLASQVLQAQEPAEAYFENLHSGFLAAGEATCLEERRLAVGPARVLLRFAGQELVPLLLPALAHLLTAESTPPTLTICVWDSASTGVAVPAFPWHPRDIRQRGEVAGYNDERFRTIYHGGVTDPTLGFNTLSMFDARTRTAIFWVKSAQKLPWTESAEPLRPVLHWGLTDDACQLLHAGAVCNEDGGVLLAGAGGSGKSTSSLACVEAGFKFVSDNYVLLTNGEAPVAHSLFCTAKVRPSGLRFHPRLRAMSPGLDPEGDEKFVFDLNLGLPERLARQAPIKALLLPRLSDSGRVAIRPASPTQGLLALAPSTIYQLPGSHGALLEPMSDLVKRVPTYSLDLGGPPDEVPGAIAELLRTELL
jgi:hypothetical protein